MNPSANSYRIALTAGEPAGIGADLCVQLAQRYLPCELVVIADPDLLKQRAEQLGLILHFHLFDPEIYRPQQAGHMTVLPIKLAEPVACGLLNPANSPYVLEIVKTGVEGCLDSTFAAMVTGPVNKAVINDAGIEFTGHTEFIAGITGGYPVMMLETPGLRVALATIHLPLAQVAKTITQDLVQQVLRVLHQDLRRWFNIDKPRILVCGLNPHAGEEGYLGREEIEVINPVLHNLRLQGYDIQGSLPADTIFTPKYLHDADVVLAMYHDQGLPVLKHKGFGMAANITLGLPIIRTSVDHGTALSLAGTGKADVGSLQYALEKALFMVSNTRIL